MFSNLVLHWSIFFRSFYRKVDFHKQIISWYTAQQKSRLPTSSNEFLPPSNQFFSNRENNTTLPPTIEHNTLPPSSTQDESPSIEFSLPKVSFMYGLYSWLSMDDAILCVNNTLSGIFKSFKTANQAILEGFYFGSILYSTKEELTMEFQRVVAIWSREIWIVKQSYSLKMVNACMRKTIFAIDVGTNINTTFRSNHIKYPFSWFQYTQLYDI